MPTFEAARSMILASVSPLGVERVDLLSALGRVVAEDVAAPWDMPFYDNSAMDGFAVRAADCRAGGSLRVTGYIPAGGTATPAIGPGCAVRIMTGAPVPPGGDAVVPVEETEQRGDAVLLNEKVSPRQHIRYRGEDVRCGDTVVRAGTVIHPPEISMLASFGKAIVPVYRRARVAVLSTGDELIELGEQPAGGKIINSNALSLAAALREIGAEPVILGIARDSRESHREKMAEGLKADALITSAGVSAGDRDLVRDCLAEIGVDQLFWKVDIKPGGPTAFGMKEGKPVFSLPGNPVSTMITFEEFVRPGILKMMGHRGVIKPYVKATLRDEVRKKPGKVHFLRVKIEVENGVNWATTAGDQNTGILGTMLRANGIAVLQKDKTVFSRGEEVAVHLLRSDVGMLEE
ncbi:gephyrin-like molybdotransferase Glp [Candidatus Deferrimicrobium sp.]|uniref:molybdopterin molybdotransferase MoeA n=1 Tax=Candidatus Deferrimicrobium sp. TaxID=3060586 RepID=UPI002EDB44D8